MPCFPRSPRSRRKTKAPCLADRTRLRRRWTACTLAIGALIALCVTVHAQTTVPTDATSATTAASSASSSSGGLGCLCKLIDPSHWEQVKQCMCKTAIGQMMNAMSMPMTAFSGGIIPSFCPPGPTAEDLAKEGAQGAAAAIAADKASAPERVAAVEYLGTVDCHFYVSAEGALIAALRTDKCDCVRWAAARVLGTGCCCTPKTIAALQITVEQSNKDGNPSETSPRVIAAAQIALTNCMLKAPQPIPVQPETPGAPPSASPPPATTGLWPIPADRVDSYVSDYYARLDYDQPAGAVAAATPAMPVSNHKIVAQHITTEATETVPETGHRGLVNILMHNFKQATGGGLPGQPQSTGALAGALPPGNLQPSPVHQPPMQQQHVQHPGTMPQQGAPGAGMHQTPVRALADSMRGYFQPGSPTQPTPPNFEQAQARQAAVPPQPRNPAPPVAPPHIDPVVQRPSQPTYPVLAPPRSAGGPPATLNHFGQAAPVDPRSGQVPGTNSPAATAPHAAYPVPSQQMPVEQRPPMQTHGGHPQPQQHAQLLPEAVQRFRIDGPPQQQPEQMERLSVPSQAPPQQNPAGQQPPQQQRPAGRPPIPAAPEPPAYSRGQLRTLPDGLVAHPLQPTGRPEPLPPIEYVRPRAFGEIIRTSY